MNANMYWSQEKVFLMGVLSLFPEELRGKTVVPWGEWKHFFVSASTEELDEELSIYRDLGYIDFKRNIEKRWLINNIPYGHKGDAKLASRIEPMVDSSKYDVMQINTQLLLLAWPNARKIFTVHTNPFEYKQAWGDCSYGKMVEITQGVATSDNVTFTAPSRHYAELFSDAIQANVTFIPHAIDVPRVISHTTKAELALRYDLDVSKLHILLPSRLEPVQKQPDLLFNALQYLPEEWLNKIEILSSGVDAQYRGYQHKFTKQANDLGCSVFFGRFDYMSDAYQLADVVVLPSQSESFGYSALESLSLGIPTILNDIPTFHEIADGHPSARFFRGDSMELSNILQSIVESGVVRMKADSGWADRYSLQRWVKQYEELM